MRAVRPFSVCLLALVGAALPLVVHPDRLLLQLEGRAGAEVLREPLPDKRLPTELLAPLRPAARPCPPGVGKGGQVFRYRRPR